MKEIKRHLGFSMVELVLVIVVTSILALSVTGILSGGFRNYFMAKSLSSLSAKAGIAMMRMTKELENATSFITADAQQLIFNDNYANTIEYSLSGSNLMRRENAGTAFILCDEVDTANFGFEYFNSALTTETDVTLIRNLNVQLTLSDANHNVALVNSITVRNER